MNATERNTETVNKDDTRLMVKVESEEVSLVNSETVILENQATIVEVNQSPSDNESGTEANNINEDLIEKEIFSDSKWNTKRARKQDVPKRRIKVIPLYADGSGEKYILSSFY